MRQKAKKDAEDAEKHVNGAAATASPPTNAVSSVCDAVCAQERMKQKEAEKSLLCVRCSDHS